MLDQDLWSVMSILVIPLVLLNLVNTHFDSDLQFTKYFPIYNLRTVGVWPVIYHQRVNFTFLGQVYRCVNFNRFIFV